MVKTVSPVRMVVHQRVEQGVADVHVSMISVVITANLSLHQFVQLDLVV